MFIQNTHRKAYTNHGCQQNGKHLFRLWHAAKALLTASLGYGTQPSQSPHSKPVGLLSCCLLQRLGSLWIIAGNTEQIWFTCTLHREQATSLISESSWRTTPVPFAIFNTEAHGGLISDQGKKILYYTGEEKQDPGSTDTEIQSNVTWKILVFMKSIYSFLDETPSKNS